MNNIEKMKKENNIANNVNKLQIDAKYCKILQNIEIKSKILQTIANTCKYWKKTQIIAK